MAMVSGMNTRGRNTAAIIPDVASACQPPTILRGFPATDRGYTRPDNIPGGAVLNPRHPSPPILYGRHRGGIFNLVMLALVRSPFPTQPSEHGYSSKLPLLIMMNIAVRSGLD